MIGSLLLLLHDINKNKITSWFDKEIDCRMEEDYLQSSIDQKKSIGQIRERNENERLVLSYQTYTPNASASQRIDAINALLNSKLASESQHSQTIQDEEKSRKTPQQSSDTLNSTEIKAPADSKAITTNQITLIDQLSTFMKTSMDNKGQGRIIGIKVVIPISILKRLYIGTKAELGKQLFGKVLYSRTRSQRCRYSSHLVAESFLRTAYIPSAREQPIPVLNDRTTLISTVHVNCSEREERYMYDYDQNFKRVVREDHVHFMFVFGETINDLKVDTIFKMILQRLRVSYVLKTNVSLMPIYSASYLLQSLEDADSVTLYTKSNSFTIEEVQVAPHSKSFWSSIQETPFKDLFGLIEKSQSRFEQNPCQYCKPQPVESSRDVLSRSVAYTRELILKWKDTGFTSKDEFTDLINNLRSNSSVYLFEKVYQSVRLWIRYLLTLFDELGISNPERLAKITVRILENEYTQNQHCQNGLKSVKRYVYEATKQGAIDPSYKMSLVIKGAGKVGKSYLCKALQRALFLPLDVHDPFDISRIDRTPSLTTSDILNVEEKFKTVPEDIASEADRIDFREKNPLIVFHHLEKNFTRMCRESSTVPRVVLVLISSVEAPMGPLTIFQYQKIFPERGEKEYLEYRQQADRRFHFAVLNPTYKEWSANFFRRTAVSQDSNLWNKIKNFELMGDKEKTNHLEDVAKLKYSTMGVNLTKVFKDRQGRFYPGGTLDFFEISESLFYAIFLYHAISEDPEDDIDTEFVNFEIPDAFFGRGR